MNRGDLAVRTAVELPPPPGEDRITPGVCPYEIYWHHAKRYTFAAQFCEGRRVADLGAGAGYGSAILGRGADLVVGLDLSPAAVRYAGRVYPARNVARLAGDVRQIPLRAGAFDVAVCFEVIEHIREHAAFLAEVRRILRPDGIFVVSTPNREIYGLPVNENRYHVGMLDLWEFEALLAGCFAEVRLFGQERPAPGTRLSEAFRFRALGDAGDPDDEMEIYVAVCARPWRVAPAMGEITVDVVP